MKTPGEQLLELIVGELRALHAQKRLFDNEQRDLGLFTAFVDAMANDPRDSRPTHEKLRRLSDALGNIGAQVKDRNFADLLFSQKRRIQQSLTQSGIGTRTVLIIADAAPIRGLLRSFLERRGFVVFAVADELDALTILDRESCCVIIIDLTTRRLSGTDFIARLSARRVTAPVLVTTSGNESAGDFDASVVRAVLKKPYDIERMAQIAAELCAGPALTKESQAG